MENTTNNQQNDIFEIVAEKDKIRALQLGFNLSKLAAFIGTICEKFTDGEKINAIDLNKNYIWLYVYDPTTGNYKDMQIKYNSCKGWAIPNGLKEKKEKNILLNLIKAASMSEKFKKTDKPKDGYFVKELENNKPTTLLKAKNKDFVTFVIFADYGKINEIDITEEKHEFDKEFFNINNNCWDAKTIRKNAFKVFAVYNKQISQYEELCKVIANKRAERKQKREQMPKELKKYFYNDKSFLNDLLYDNNLHFYNTFSHNSLEKHEFDICSPGLEIVLNGNTILHTVEKMTRQQVFNYCVDKSGFFVLGFREKMLRRLYTLKAERARAKDEQERKEWKASDKTELKAKVNYMLNYLLTEITKRSLFDDKSFEELKKYRELYKRFEKQLNFDNYNSVSDWQKYFDEKMKDFNFYDRAIKKSVLDRVACVHHYERQQDGSYINISKDSFFKDASRYVQEF